MSIAPRTPDTVAEIDATPDPKIVATPVSDTVVTVVFDDCHAAVDVRSSVAPFDNVAVAVSCDWPVAVKLDGPETATLVTVGVEGGAGAVGVGLVGDSSLLEQAVVITHTHNIVKQSRVMQD